MSLADAWEARAEAWIEWARRPGHDGFWDGTWPLLASVLPDPAGVVVEVGCGEGRVGRELLALGHRVVGVERSPTLARAARSHGSTPLVVSRADAAHLPLRDTCTDCVVACMSLHDVDDLPSTVHEIWRVLRTGGHLCVALVHPFSSAGAEPYLAERRVEYHAERDGLAMTFASTHRPLGDYLALFADAGFVLDRLHEHGSNAVPWLLVLRLRRPNDG